MFWGEIRNNLAHIWGVSPESVTDEDVLAFKKSGSGVPIDQEGNKSLNQRPQSEPSIPVGVDQYAGPDKNTIISGQNDDYVCGLYDQTVTKAEQ